MQTVPQKNNQGPEILVEKIQIIGKGSLKAFATILIDGKLRVHSLRIIQQPDQDIWVALPQSEVPPKNPGEKRKFFPVVEAIDPTLKTTISFVVLAAYQRVAAQKP